MPSRLVPVIRPTKSRLRARRGFGEGRCAKYRLRPANDAAARRRRRAGGQPHVDFRSKDLSDHGRCRGALALVKRGCDELLIEAEFAQKLARSRATASPALQAGAGSHGARHPPRPHGRAEQAATAAGPRPHGDLPDRRLHFDDRRPVGEEHVAAAAHPRGKSRPTRGPTSTRPRWCWTARRPRSATTRSGPSRWARPA